MEQEKEKSDLLDYWEVRREIELAVRTDDKLALLSLANMYPKIFDNVLRQAKNSTKV